MRRGGLMAIVVAVAVAGCGSSGNSGSHTPKNIVVNKTPVKAGQRTFSAPGMAIHFQYPSAFHAGRLTETGKSVGGSAKATSAAIGISNADLIIVAYYPLTVAITQSNLAKVQPTLDNAISTSAGHAVTSTPTTVKGYPALSYTPQAIHLPGVPAGTRSTVTAVFIGKSEYELQCQSTPKGRAKIAAACAEMLQTLSG